MTTTETLREALREACDLAESYAEDAGPMQDVYAGRKHVVFTSSDRARTMQRFRYHNGAWQTLGDVGFVTFTCLRTRDMFERATLVDAESLP